MEQIIATLDVTPFIRGVDLFIFLHRPLVQIIGGCLIIFAIWFYLRKDPTRSKLSIATFLLITIVVFIFVVRLLTPSQSHLLPTEEQQIPVSANAKLA